jgi:hypothetical protein
MPFRMLENGVVEVDTLDELRLLQGKKNRERQPRAQSRPSKRSVAALSDEAKRFLLLLMTAKNGSNTTDIAKRLGLEARQIPPILRTLSRWCGEKKVDRDTLLTTRMDYVDRKPVTTYTLTDQGKTVFGPMAAEQSPNLNGKDARSQN